MDSNFLQYYKPKVLIGFIVALGIGIYLAKENWGLQIGVLGVIVSVLSIINCYLWRYKPFLWMFWIDDFSGTYEGFLEYQYFDETEGVKKNDRLKHIKVINQKGNQICVSSFTMKSDGTKSSHSTNVGIYVEKPHDDHYRLIYHFINDGDSLQGFPPHYGTEVVKFIKKENGEKCLSGKYYTERHPYQTKGQYIDLKKISNKLIHEF